MSENFPCLEKSIIGQTQIINQQDLIDIYRTLPPTMTEYKKTHKQVEINQHTLIKQPADQRRNHRVNKQIIKDK